MCSLCNLYAEIPSQMFCEYDYVKLLCSDLVQGFQNNLILPTLTLQTAIFGFLDSANNDPIFDSNKAFINHILLIYLSYICASWEKKVQKYR